MKIVVAPNAFKDSLTAREASEAIIRGITKVVPDAECVHVHVADGGDGLFLVFQSVFGGETVTKTVTGPLGKAQSADFLFIPETKTAVIEMARASGLALLKPEERNARATTTYGTGELTLAAIEKGASKIIVGIGGSATNDGGIGFAAALGVKFLDGDGKEVDPIGESLPSIRSVDVSGLKIDPAKVSFEAVCDVDNPLTGERGASAVFGPQKGAKPDDVAYLDSGLANLAQVVKKDLNKDLGLMSGAGAAGGLGFGLASFVNAQLRPGVDVVLDMVGIDKALDNADLAFTAEGAIDFQTAFGKGPAGVGMRAKKKGVPCIAIGGGVIGDIANLHDIGIDACFSLCRSPMSLDDAMKNGSELLAFAAEQSLRAFLAGKRK